jgi:tetratricopeptide (TPR) repeat protein
MALQHFIDGSIYELKREHAQAVLEFQDALRYEQNHAIYYALSRNYSELYKHSLAIEAAREAVRLDPENIEYRRNLAEVYTVAFELDSAAAQYQEILARDSASIESWYGLARLYQSRKPLKALEVYEDIIRRFGPTWEVLFQIAELHGAMGEFAKAAQTLKQMSDLDPGNVALRRSVAQAYVRAEQFDEALAVYNELQEVNPDDLENLVEIAGVHLLRKEYKKAAEQFEAVLSRDTVSIEIKLRIGEIYFSRLEEDSTLAPMALSLFERIRDTHPQDWRPYWFLGAVGAIMNNDSVSVPNFKKVTELAGWNADGWVYLSTVFLEKNRYEEVATVLESALRVLPDEYRINFLLGVAYSRLGRSIDAARVLEHAYQLNPKDVNVLAQLALVYDGLKSPEESDRLYEEALKLDPDNHLVLNNYSYSLAERGLQLERALEMAKKAVQAQPENSSYLDTIGWVYFRLGDYEKAEEYVKRAIEKGNASAVLYEHLGDIYEKMNDKDRALEQWNISLKMDEQNTPLREKIRRALP